MTIKFTIEYATSWGEHICIIGSDPSLGKWKVDKKVFLKTNDGRNWEVEVNIDAASFEYKYLVFNTQNNQKTWEFGENRTLNFGASSISKVQIIDVWRSSNHPQNVFYTLPFKQAYFKHELPKSPKKINLKSGQVRFSLRNPRVEAGKGICILGSSAELGSWNAAKAVPLQPQSYSLWEAIVPVNESVNYKYAIYDLQSNQIETWESGGNRFFSPSDTSAKCAYLVNDDYFEDPVGNWKAAGVALPVFSIRTEKSGGVGEFTDIPMLVDWAKHVGLKMVQILPVNDTIATKTWVDSYPYGAISVFALNPMYANVEALGASNDEVEAAKIIAQLADLNQLDKVDFEQVLSLKTKFFKLAFKEVGKPLLKSADFQAYFKANEHWLKAYAAFCYLRDHYGTVDFTTWPKYQSPSLADINSICDEKSKHFNEIALHYFVQFHLDKQLKQSSEYARSQGVTLKGDLPIGVYRYSVDAWVSPHLYNMSGQAGAPPDHYSIAGQNWGFPTYNWAAMAEDNYLWWRQRLNGLSQYFDTYRIDHILGFFRIWQVPYEQIEGLLGKFNPSLPFTEQELRNWGLPFDFYRYCKPYIRQHMLHEIFGDLEWYVLHNCLNQIFDHGFELKTEFDTQRKVKDWASNCTDLAPEQIKTIQFGLYQLIGNFIFHFDVQDNQLLLDPRIALHQTYSYRELDNYSKGIVNELYTHYFYKRHDQFWKEKAYQKLPALKQATEMLICGEDLGMLTDSVTEVMRNMQILSLEVHAMPKTSVEFNHPADNAYFSVCSTSTHDSSTLRGWWEESKDAAQRYFNNMLGHFGQAPYFCEPYIVREILNQYLHSPSMLAIFPLQDLMAVDGDLRFPNPHEERINVPAITQHYWRYRMHLTVEELLQSDRFNRTLKSLIQAAGR